MGGFSRLELTRPEKVVTELSKEIESCGRVSSGRQKTLYNMFSE